MDYDWRGRGCWIGRTDSGIPRSVLRDRYRMDTLLYSTLDPGAKVHIAAARNEGFQVGVYADPHWYDLAGDGHALDFRKKVDAAVSACGVQADEHVMIDPENCSMSWLWNAVVGAPGNRGLFASSNNEKPMGTQEDKRGHYTNAPFQNHTVVNMPAIVRGRLHWDYQLYYGGMEPADGNGVVLEILRDFRSWAGQNWSEKTHPFYDGARYVDDQRDGWWFTAERLSGVFATSAKLVAAEELKHGLAEWGKIELRDHYRKLAESA
jgi:hypothetical protein